MKRINYTLVLVGLALTTFLFFSSMKKIGDIKDKFDESEQVENGVISDDSLAMQVRQKRQRLQLKVLPMQVRKQSKAQILRRCLLEKCMIL